MIMHCLPRCPTIQVETQRRCRAGWIAERKVESEKDTVAPACQLGDHVFKEGARLQARLDVHGTELQLQPRIAGQHTDPDRVGACRGLCSRAPVHHDVSVEKARHD